MNNQKSSERGQALVVIALAAVVLFGFVALAIDGTAKFSDRRHAQNAADTAALAGALAYVNGNINWKVEALDRAADNGYNNNLVSSEVWVYLCNDPNRTAAPMTCGPYEGRADYLEVVIRSHIDTTFARVLGFAQTHNLVQAVTYVKEGGPLFDGASFVSVNPNPTCSGGAGAGGGSFDVGGSGNIILNGGGIFVNSDASCGYSQTSCNASLTINGGGINTAGSGVNLGGCVMAVPTDTSHEQVLVPEEIYMPDEPDACNETPLPPVPLYGAGGYDWQLNPGLYLSNFPPTALVGVNQHIKLASGIYCIDKTSAGTDVTWNGNKFALFTATDGYGVTFYVKGGVGFNININSPITLNATSDPNSEYYGYLIIVDGNHNSHPSCTINGGSYLHLNGTIYAPYCNVTINGDNASNSQYNVQVIGWDVKLNGNNTINFTYNPADNAQNKRRVGLMR